MAPGGTGRRGQVTLEVGEDRARQVALPVAVQARRAAEAPPHVQQGGSRLAGQILGQFGQFGQFLGQGCGRDQEAARAGHQRTLELSAGTSWSAAVSEPCMPTSADSRGSVLVATMASDPTGAATTSPIRSARLGSTGPNQPSLIASSLDMTQARSARISRQVARTSPAAPASA